MDCVSYALDCVSYVGLCFLRVELCFLSWIVFLILVSFSWTFGSSEALSSAYAVKTGVMIDISEQQIVDCAWGYVSSQACDGGFAPGAYEYIMKQGGAATEIHCKLLCFSLRLFTFTLHLHLHITYYILFVLFCD